jgi:TPR repeat protein
MGALMAFRSSRRFQVVFLSAFCLLYAAGAEAKRGDTSQAEPTSVPELQTKAAQGYVKQELELAAHYLTGKGVPKDLSQAVYWYRKAADQGDPGAEVDLGYLYAAGIGVSRDAAAAATWYRRAASSGSPNAKVNLAGLYMHGDGVKQDFGEALRLLKSAADQGNGRADAYLGLASYLGSGTPVDHSAAEAWFRKGVKQHDPEAEFFLALLDTKEPGRVPDLAGDAELLRRSAGGGYVDAFHTLGLLLVHHPELPQAKDEAVNALLTAAGEGSWQSSAALGILACEGRLLPKDQRAGYRWYRIAVLQGGSPAEAYVHPELQRLAKSIADPSAIEQEATAWQQMHPNHDFFVFKNGFDPKYFPIQEVYATVQGLNADQKAGKQPE